MLILCQMVNKSMEININELIIQKRELERYADELREVKSRLIIHKKNLEGLWLSYEAEGIYDAIDCINYRLEMAADEMNQISRDMLRAYGDICEEKIEGRDSDDSN